MREDELVERALAAAREVLSEPLSIERGAALLYQVTVDNRLQLTVDPLSPKRGRSAFQTDLCVFEQVEPDIRIPRVVLEFKQRVTTHDVITYSVKARRHKQVYPYLRYGLVLGSDETIPGRFFQHNEALDFCVATAGFAASRLRELLARVIGDEVDASRNLEQITTGQVVPHLYRLGVLFEEGAGRIS